MARVNRHRGGWGGTFAVLLLALAGCEGGVSGTGGADAASRVDAGPRLDAGAGEADAASGSGGLVLEFTPKRPLPGAQGGSWDAEVTSASMRLRDLVVVGDTAPGDARTQLASVPLAWGGPDEPLDRARLPEAPAGRYSRLEARVAELHLAGTLGGEVAGPFAIDLEPSSGWPFAFSFEPVALAPGGEATIDVEVDVREFIDAVDWATVDVSDGTRVVEPGSDAADQLEEKADDVFDHP